MLTLNCVVADSMSRPHGVCTLIYMTTAALSNWEKEIYRRDKLIWR